MQGPNRAQDFERLVRDHHAAVYRTAFAILRRDDQALDVAQQVFVRVLEGKERLEAAEDEARVLRWIAARQALMHQRSQGTRREKEHGESMAEQHFDARPEEVELREILARLVATLPEPLRNALVLRFEEQRTFAEIGLLVGASESTVHERVTRGLEKLRSELGRLGFGAFVPALEHSLATPEAIAIPAGLQAKLVALGATSVPAPLLVAGAGGLAWAWLAVAGALLVAGLAAWLAPWKAGDAGPVAGASRLPATEVASIDAPALAALREAVPAEVSPPDGALARAREAVASSMDKTADAWIEGRIVDAEGRALAGVELQVVHSGSKGGWFELNPSVESDFEGRFRLELESTDRPLREFDLLARKTDFVELQREHLRVEAGKGLQLGNLTMLRNSEDLEGEFELVLGISDPQGRPVVGAIARLFREVRLGDGKTQELIEAHGPSDAGGTVILRGQKLGKKRLSIDAHAQGWRCDPIAWVIDAPGSQRKHVTLVPGLVIAGVLRGPDGGPPPQIYVFHAYVDSQLDSRYPEIDAHGRFRFLGLDPGTYTLRCSARDASTFQLEGVAAGREDLDLRMKRSDEVRDVGLHRGEIHCLVVDRRTGREFLITEDDIQIRWVEAETEEALRNIELPTQRERAQYQTVVDGSRPKPRADFHFHDLDAGAYVVRVDVEGLGVGFSRRIELGRDELVTGVRIEVAPGVLCGRVLDAAGLPAGKAYVLATGSGAAADAAIQAFDTAVQGKTVAAILAMGAVACSEDGSFVLEELPADLHFRVAAAAAGDGLAISEPWLPAEDRSQPRELRLSTRLGQ